MARLNVPYRQGAPKTHEGGRAKRINPEQQLRRSVMACMLWEKTFYEDGISIADRICSLVPKVEAHKVHDMAITARHDMKLRHVSLLLIREMARYDSHKKYVASAIWQVIRRPDEMAELLSIYWAQGKAPLSAQIKKGLASVFPRFDEYQLAKWNRPYEITLRDVLFLCHAKPKDAEQDALWKRLINNELAVPDTWEVELSASKDKHMSWTRLLNEQKLGCMALLRNLRNIQNANVDKDLIRIALKNSNPKWVLPFRFIAAARYAPHLEDILEELMFKGLANMSKLSGETVLLVDSSGSMDGQLSSRSDMTRYDAACGLAILCRELCESVEIFDFAGDIRPVPNRRGFALRDAIRTPHNGTRLGMAVNSINTTRPHRLIVLTDEQSWDPVSDPYNLGYMVNIAVYKNGVGYGKWTHIDGWSEAILSYIAESEK